jgi:hypothetical protein
MNRFYAYIIMGAVTIYIWFILTIGTPFPVRGPLREQAVLSEWEYLERDGQTTFYKRTGRIVLPMHIAIFDEYMSDDPPAQWLGHIEMRPRVGPFAVGIGINTLVAATMVLLIERRHRRRALAGAKGGAEYGEEGPAK